MNERLTSSGPTCGFTIIELVIVVAIATILTSTGMVVTMPMLSRGAFNQSLAKLEDLNQQARLLARHQPASVPGFYGVVITQQGERLHGAITFGTNASSATIALDGSGKPLGEADLGLKVRLFTGSSHGSATMLLAGSEVSWMFRTGNGMLAISSARTLIPTTIGIANADLVAAGVVPNTTLIGEAVSLRTPDNRRSAAIAVYPSGVIVTSPLAGR